MKRPVKTYTTFTREADVGPGGTLVLSEDVVKDVVPLAWRIWGYRIALAAIVGGVVLGHVTEDQAFDWIAWVAGLLGVTQAAAHVPAKARRNR